MIGWGTIVYGASLSAVFATAAIGLGLRERHPAVVLPAVIAAFAGPISWNAILRATHAGEFFTDAPIPVFPVSWQDTGSGVVTFAVGSFIIGALHRRMPAGRVVAVAVVAGLVAFVVDIYLY